MQATQHQAIGAQGAAAVPSRFTQRFLAFTGVLSGAFGAVLVVAPDLHPMLSQVAAKFSSAGIHPVSMLMVGVGLFGLGMVAKVFTHSLAVHTSDQTGEQADSDFMLVADQLATDMAQSLSMLMQISSEIAELSENNRTLLRNMPDANGQATANQTPMFRLAASVDKLCASVDSRLSNLGLELNASMQGVTTSLSQVRGEMQQVAPSLQPDAAVSYDKPDIAQGPLVSLPHPMDPLPAQEPEPEAAVLPEPEAAFESPALDLFDQMEERPMEQPDPAAPFGSNQALDPIDDLLPKYSNPSEGELDI